MMIPGHASRASNADDWSITRPTSIVHATVFETVTRRDRLAVARHWQKRQSRTRARLPGRGRGG
jgi:hypothetical protein